MGRLPRFCLELTIGALAVAASAADPWDSSEALNELSDLSLEDLLDMEVTSLKTGTDSNASAADVDMIARDEILEMGYRSIAELVAHLPGFFVMDQHQIPIVSIRGISGGVRAESGIIKVLIDGQPVGIPTTGANWLGPELLPLSAVERVEVIRGPVSSLYGADAFMGVINVITRKGEEVSGAEVTAGTSLIRGQPGRRLEIVSGAKRGKTDFLVSASEQEEDRSGLLLPDGSPNPRLPSYNQGQVEADGLVQLTRSGLAKLRYELSSKAFLFASGYYSFARRGDAFTEQLHLSHGIDDAGREVGTVWENRQAVLSTGGDAQVNDEFTLRSRASFSTGGPSDDSRIEVGSNAFWVQPRTRFQAARGSVEGELKPSPGVHIVSGLDFLHDNEWTPSFERRPKGQAAATSASQQPSPPTIAAVDMGAYAQGAYTTQEDELHVVAGLRVDHHSVYQSQLSPRAGAAIQPGAGFTVKLLYGRAFRAPSPYRLYAEPAFPGDVLGNESLKPQFVDIVQWQTVWNHFEDLELRTTVAYNRLRDKVEFVHQGVNRVARNVGKTESWSWDSDARYRLSDVFSARLSISLNRTKKRRGTEGYVAELLADRNEVYPELIGHAGLVGRVPALSLKGSVNATYVGSLPASDVNVVEAGREYELPGHLLISGLLTFDGVSLFDDRRTEIRAGVHNALDETGPNPGYTGVDVPLPPRTFVAEIRQKF